MDKIIKKYIPDIKDVKQDNNLILFEVKPDELRDICISLYHKHQLPLKTISAAAENGSYKIFYVFGIPQENIFLVPFIKLVNTVEFPSLTTKIHEFSWYELEIYTFFGLKAIGHPSLHQIILHENWPTNIYPLRKEFKWNFRPKDAHNIHHFEKIEGEGIYEIPVGPVHAGIIEPGHFRFSVMGEEIVSLEPRLGYVHKGSEKLFEVLPIEDKIKLSERISGDSSFNHSLAFCQALEILSGTNVPKRAEYLRVIYAELERLANHFNDIGFIMMDTSYTFGGSQCARLREIVMQINEKLTGSRFLRGVNKIGGVRIDITGDQKNELQKQLKDLEKDFREVIEIAEDSTSMINRLIGAGVLDKQVAKDHGAVGIAARAIGLKMDARRDYPYAAYPNINFSTPISTDGDVYGRFQVRIEEVYQSFNVLQQALGLLSKGEISINKPVKLAKNSHAVGITEGWRGDIVYFVVTDSNGDITRVMVRDPSFLNWAAMKYAVEENVVPDFPLINKSFNLSYSGYDR